MSIIEDALKRAGAEEVKVEDLRPGDKFVLLEEDNAYEGIFDRSEEGLVYRREPTFSLTICDDQRWYLVERAPVEEPTGWGAIVEVAGVKYSRIPDHPQDGASWVARVGEWFTWDGLTSRGVPKVLFEGISE